MLHIHEVIHSDKSQEDNGLESVEGAVIEIVNSQIASSESALDGQEGVKYESSGQSSRRSLRRNDSENEEGKEEIKQDEEAKVVEEA